MKEEGDFLTALDNSLIRAYIANERINIEEANPRLSRTYVRDFASLLIIKILKLLYVGLTLQPEFVD